MREARIEFPFPGKDLTTTNGNPRKETQEQKMRAPFFNPAEDSFIRGAIAGIIGGTIKDIPAAILELVLKSPHPTFWDYMSLLAIGRLPKSWDEYLFALIIQVLWCTVLAIAFVYLHPKLKSRHYILQGAGLGVFIWLLIRATVYFFRVPELIHTRPLTALLNVSISVLYGIIVAFVDHKLKFRSRKLK